MDKLYVLFYRLRDFTRWLPRRLLRLLQHVLMGLRWNHYYQSSADPTVRTGLANRISHWWLEFAIYLLEIVGIGELYETLTDGVKWKTRPLKATEIQLARSIFGDHIRYERVRIDEYALIGPRQYPICYVSFYVINSWGKMKQSTLIHELVHVWQYQQIGAVYMPRALRAQYTRWGYNYGGVAKLRAYLAKGQDFLAFNLEQQADIVEDYFRIRQGLSPKWGRGQQSDLDVYEKILHPLWRESNLT